MPLLIGILGAVVIVSVLWDAFETIILPRRVTRKFRLTAFFFRNTWRPWAWAMRRVRNGRRRESLLAYYGPLSTLLLLLIWAVGLVLGFAMLQWSLGSNLRAAEHAVGFGTDLYMSGTTLFTLGLGDVTPGTPAARFFTAMESGLGLGFLALVISYLPVLYQAFSRREVTIVLLDARAGSPSTASEMLRRYSKHLDELAAGMHELEHWTAELLEGNISYPVLAYFRSQHDNQSWLQSLTTVLDTCALVIVGIDGLSSWHAEMTFAMGRHAVVDIAQILRTPPRPPDPDRLPPAEFERLRTALAQSGLRLADGGRARERLAQLRAMYEPYVNALSFYLLMRLPEWVGSKGRVHNWQTSAWGRTAAAKPVNPADPADTHE